MAEVRDHAAHSQSAGNEEPGRAERAGTVPLDLAQIKERELEILLAFNEMCTREGFTFYLCGGTLLGAVRHQGFIPWDDDIDICLTRPDYDRLAALAGKKQLLPDRYRITCYENSTSRFPFIKVLDTTTRVRNEFFADSDNDHLWIDVLPVDGLPDDDREIRRLYRQVFMCRKLIQMKYIRPFTGKSGLKGLLKTPLNYLFRLLPVERLNRFIIRRSKEFPFEMSARVGIVTEGLYGEREAMPREEYVKPVTVMFEGHEFKACSCMEYYLGNLFGDYMKLPPEEKRKSHDMVVTG